jgi:hypothetical protein
MHSGKSLSESAREVLLENAQWMRYENTRKWEIKHPLCTGYVESDLESVDYIGFETIKFKALIDTPEGTTDVEFVIRISDLDDFCMSKMQWAKKVSESQMDPELVQGAHRAIHEMMEREGIEDYEIGEGEGITIEGDGSGPLVVYSSDEEPESGSIFSDN